MPGYLAEVEIEEPVEIPGTGGETVRFRSCATYSDEVALGIATQAEFPSQNGEGPDPQRIEAFAAQRTCLMIAEWTLRNRQGEVMAIHPDVITRALKRQVASWLIEQARIRYDGRPEEQEGPFVSRSPQPSEATQ